MEQVIYIAMGIHVENGQASNPNTRQFTDRFQADRQFHLYCAAAATSNYPIDTAILMTADGFVLEKKSWVHPAPEPEPEPEVEPEVVEGK